MPSEMSRHPDPEELERLALAGRPGGLVAAGDGDSGAADHVAGCTACRQEVAELRALDAAFTALPRLEPTAAFMEGVMARVQLRRPWYVRAWQAVRTRQMVTFGILVAAIATAGGVAVWRLRFPGITPGDVAGFLGANVGDLAVQGMLAVARLLYEGGWIDGIGRLANAITVPDAAAGLVTLGLMGLGAMLSMIRLLHGPNGAALARRHDNPGVIS